MASIIPFISKLHIVDKSGVSRQLGPILSWPQKDLLRRIDEDIQANRLIRKQVLKARQVGMSTIIEGFQFSLAMMWENFQGLVIAHENKSSTHLLGMMQHYYKTFWMKRAYPTRFFAANQLAWEPIGSHVTVATAKNASAGRSQTLHFLHASEVAFWPAPELLMTGLLQTVPRVSPTSVFLESTAHGVGGYFYDNWSDAGSEFEKLFYPWWAHPEYTAHRIGMGHMTEGKLYLSDDEERHLAKFLAAPRKINGIPVPPMEPGEIKSRLVWRRMILGTECRGDLNTLHQEYPSDPEEAFIATGTNIFNLGRLRKIYQPMEGTRGRLVREGEAVRFIPDDQGELTIYRSPSDSREFGWYMVGGDPKKATEGDWACAQVLNRKTWEQVAELRVKCDQNTFGEHMIKLAQYYNNAMVAPESGMGGPGVVAHIIARGYPHIYQHRKSNKMPGQLDQSWGWVSNNQTKPEAIGNLQSALYDATDGPGAERGIGIRIHSPILFVEMQHYVVLPDGSYGNAKGETDHDDTIMALAIALTCTKHERAMMAEDPRYQAPRYHAKGYQSSLTADQVDAFEGVLRDHAVPEGPMAREGGGMDEGDGQDVPWIADEPYDMYSGGIDE